MAMISFRDNKNIKGDFEAIASELNMNTSDLYRDALENYLEHIQGNINVSNVNRIKLDNIKKKLNRKKRFNFRDLECLYDYVEIEEHEEELNIIGYILNGVKCFNFTMTIEDIDKLEI
ncbi:hypothetical protein UT300012_21950 [Paraclostridium bifermentans]